ncbi:MAG: flagellar protein FlaG [Candidatus Accumulibacter sp.]|uniref:flagellar protein FlaG n=1 Tax=Accumulibacter sp. TaxID=2053492 RepID=UPI001A04C472|nr:flagellar protein FlaG [Accumulibacter sp.]MBE2258000.1 flagellar protein FlaG [Paracoccaceae bacterium]MCP5247583.1 flagellar protein FlaG [Accumulibacter sp.]
MNIPPAGASLQPQGNALVSNGARATAGPGDTLPAAAALSRTPSPAQQPDRDKLEVATQSVREFVKPINSNIEFSVNEDTGQLVVRIIDRATKEVIRQMPSEEMLSIAKALDSIKGLFVTQTA